MRKFIYTIFLSVAVCAFMACSKAGATGHGDAPDSLEQTDELPACGVLNPDQKPYVDGDPKAEMPGKGCVKLKTKPLPGSYRKLFNDSNYVHYAEAEQYGIKPVDGEFDPWHQTRPLVHIVSTPEYHVNELTHSVPYLVPEAADRLSEIGRRFNAKLAAQGGGRYRLRVTSLLRTSNHVSRLRRVNRAAVDSSVHRFGTTFDISYSRFVPGAKLGTPRTAADLKALLSEVVYEMQQEGKIYVKYEHKSGCMHITARRKNN